MNQSELQLAMADALIAALVASGVEEAVVSPGARSTPLVLACVRHRGLRVRVIQDERSAAFFALGMVRASGRPAAVVGTSGTAPAHWYPAVIEASQDHQPLVLLSADRPNELHGCGANQTVDQHRMFGVHARAYFDLIGPGEPAALVRFATALGAHAVAESRGPNPGPVQINAPFRESLVPDTIPFEPAATGTVPRIDYAEQVLPDGVLDELAKCLSGQRGVIVCGRLPRSRRLARAVTSLAGRLACPVLADPLSNLRFGGHDRSQLIWGYDQFLESTDAAASGRPQWALILGGISVSTELQRYMANIGEQILVSPWGPWPDTERRATRVLRGDPVDLCERLVQRPLEPVDASWLAGFHAIRSRLIQVFEEHGTALPVEARILRALFAVCRGGTRVFCGNSMVIRDVDAFVAGNGQDIGLAGNRGASGIDGNVSTILGMAAVHSGPVVGLLGDLAFYHDMNGLIAARDVSATLILFNNGGGGIFSYLPQARLEGFQEYWRTPLDLNFAHAATLYGLGFDQVTDEAAFEAAFTTALERPGVDLIEVMVDHEDSVRRHRTFETAIRRAVSADSMT